MRSCVDEGDDERRKGKEAGGKVGEGNKKKKKKKLKTATEAEVKENLQRKVNLNKFSQRFTILPLNRRKSKQYNFQFYL